MAKTFCIKPRGNQLTKTPRIKLYATLKNGDGKPYYVIVMRVVLGREIYNTSLCNVLPEAWDCDRMTIRDGFMTTKGVSTTDINKTIDKIIAGLKTRIKELQPGESLSDKEARSIAKSILGRAEAERPMFADYLEYLSERAKSKSWSDKNVLREHRISKLFMDYADGRGYGSLSPSFIESFAMHLKAGGFHDENIQKMVSSVNGFLQWSKRHGKEIPDGRYVYRFRKVQKPVVYLNKDELARIIHFAIPKSGTTVTLCSARGRNYQKKVDGAESLGLVRDFLLFCCLTGLRYAELQMLQKKHVKNGLLSFVTPKTNTPRSIELNKYSLALIDKYAFWPDKGNYLFPRLSNQKANQHLHDLMELCEINEPVFSMSLIDGVKTERMTPKFECATTHIGRKTFVCQALLSGLSPELITMWTGHASVDDMRPYMAAASEAKKTGMDKLYSSLFIG